jgi:hypothetical protein
MEDVRCPHSHVPGEVNNQRVSNGRGKHIMSWEQRAGGGAATLRNIAGRQAGRQAPGRGWAAATTVQYCLTASMKRALLRRAGGVALPALAGVVMVRGMSEHGALGTTAAGHVVGRQ